jgi:putative Mn2+ efflux pump MntP
MNLAAIVMLALAMSTDAFAAAVGKGTALHRPRWSEALRTGVIFGAIEAVTPLVGWALGRVATEYVTAWNHWIAFVLLAGLGSHMIIAAWRASDDVPVERPGRHGFWVLAATGFATSIDAMAVGVGLAFVDVAIVPVAAAIGFATFVMVTIGVMVGRLVGSIAGRWAEALGGVVLIGIGAGIVYEHLRGAT